jgi:uncharacterized protein
MPDVSLLVIAKEPLPGRVKTRLTPPLLPVQAARLASAALADTLDVVAGTPSGRKVLVFDGDPGSYAPDGFEVIAQRGGGLGERLADAFADVGGPALLVGMDTPQLTQALLSRCIRELSTPGVDAVLGRATDGGYWSIGLRRPVPGAFADVPMSDAHTWARQRARLQALGMNVVDVPMLRDVDTIADARAVARLAPRSRFATALGSVAA